MCVCVAIADVRAHHTVSEGPASWHAALAVLKFLIAF